MARRRSHSHRSSRVSDPETTQRSSRRRRRRRRRSKRRIVVASVLLVALVAVTLGSTYLLRSYMDSRGAARYEQALLAFEAGNYEHAVRALEQVLAGDADNLSAMVLIGRAYLRLRYTEQAEQALRKAQQSGAHPAVVEVPLTEVYLQQGKFQQLIDEFPARSQDPRLRGQLLLMHGQAHLQLRQYDAAQRAFARASNLLPDEQDPLTGQALVALHNGRADVAQQLVERAALIEPDSAQVWFVNGEIARSRGQLVQSMAAYTRTIELDPGHLPARLARAAMRISADQNDGALQDLQAAEALHGDDPQVSFLHALIRTRLGEHDRAQSLIKQASSNLLRYSTDFVMRHPPSLLLMSVSRFRDDSFDQAAPLLHRYVLMEPGDLGARKMLASVQLIRDLPALALQTLSPAPLTPPGDAQAAAPAPRSVAPVPSSPGDELHLLAASIELIHDLPVPALSDGASAQSTPLDDPQSLGLLAQAHSQSGQHDEAARLLWQAIAGARTGSGDFAQQALIRLALSGDRTATVDARAPLDLDAGFDRVTLMLRVLQQRSVKLEQSLQTARVLAREQPRQAVIENLRGALALSLGALDESRSALEQALAVDPGLRPAVRNLARVHLASADPDAARAGLQALLASQPDDSRAMVVMAQLEAQQQQFEAAIDWLQRANEIEALDLSAQLELVDLYLHAQRIDDARVLVRTLAERFPDSALVRRGSERVNLAGEGGLRSGSDSHDETLQGNDAQSLYRLAGKELDGNNLEAARAILQRVVSMNPDYLPAVRRLVEIQLREGNADAALQLSASVRRRHPQLAVGDQLYADTLVYMARFDEAVDIYREALGKSNNAQLMVRLYRARVLQGQAEQAVAQLRQWAEQHGYPPLLRRALADGYLRVGENAQALRAYEVLLQENPHDPLVLSALARLVLDSDKARAHTLATRAHSLGMTQADALDTLGWVMVNDGEVAEGLSYLREARNRDVRELRIRFHIAAALARLGRVDDARRELQRVLAGNQVFEGSKQARQLLSKLGG